MPDYDVIVVGAGNAALAAAVSAREQGAGRVVALEKAPRALRGGNTLRFVDEGEDFQFYTYARHVGRRLRPARRRARGRPVTAWRGRRAKGHNSLDSARVSPRIITAGGGTMQIGQSRRLEETRRTEGPLTVDGFLARFPEVPRDLRAEPLLAEFVQAFAPQLAVAAKPSPCVARAGGGDMEHHFYMSLVNDLAVYGLGLARRERTLQRLHARLEKYREQRATFACTLVPRKVAGAPRTGCG